MVIHLLLMKRILQNNRDIFLGACINYFIKKINHKIIVYAPTAHNRTVYASPPVGGSGFRSARSFRYAPIPRLTPPTFWPPCKCYAFAYSGGQNVVNSRNDMRNANFDKYIIVEFFK
jgi:hypothetical protein